MPNPEPPLERGRQLARLSSFSDGLFTIAATLLVLSIDLPTGPASDLDAELDGLIEPVAVYFLSFAVIGAFWLRHHELFGRLHASDSRFATLNLAFLSFIALLPAPTEILGRYGGTTAATVVYAANIIVLSLLLRALHDYAARHGLADVELESAGPRRRAAIVLAVFAVSIPIAFVEPRLATYVWVLAAILPRLPPLRATAA